MELERIEAAAELEKGATKKLTKKRKRNPDPLVGELSKRFELITNENFKRHKVSIASNLIDFAIDNFVGMEY